MRPAALLVAAAVAAVAGLAVVLPAAATTVVGYLPPGINYGTTTENADDTGGGNSQPELQPGQIRAQGLVVDQLEPGQRNLGTKDVCPPGGCAYALVVLDTKALDAAAAAAGDEQQASGCNSLDFATIDPDPASRPLGGARVYTARGRLPADTTPPAAATDHPPRPVAAGLGHLCLIAKPGNPPLTNNDGTGPLAATQPKPVVVFHDGTASPGS